MEDKKPEKKYRIADIVHIVIEVAMAILTCYSVFLVRDTLFEMQEERNLAYAPDILVNPVTITAKLPRINSYGYIDVESYEGERVALHVVNAGVGIAKNIELWWDESCVTQLINVLASKSHQDEEYISYLYQYDSEYWEPEEYNFTYMLSNAQEEYAVRIPYQYLHMIISILNRTTVNYITGEEMPKLVLNLTYSDVQGIDYEKKYEFQYDIESFTENMELLRDNEGEITYQLIPIEIQDINDLEE